MHQDGPSKVALSIKQPWAELILRGVKSIEIRTWGTTFRGRIWIHTGQRPDEEALLLFPVGESLFRGGYVGSVEVASIERFTHASWIRLRDMHLVSGPMRPDMFGWFLTGVKRLREPFPGPGQVGLFEIPPSLADQLQSRLAA